MSMLSPVEATVGAMRQPARAAKKKPNIHPIWATRWGLAPARATRSGSSTTARMATPTRNHRKKYRVATATATATMTVRICW